VPQRTFGSSPAVVGGVSGTKPRIAALAGVPVDILQSVDDLPRLSAGLFFAGGVFGPLPYRPHAPSADDLLGPSPLPALARDRNSGALAPPVEPQRPELVRRLPRDYCRCDGPLRVRKRRRSVTSAAWHSKGVVSKRATSRYRSGRCATWVKVKNPAYERR